MLAVYLACLIFGGALLAFSLIFGGEHSDADAGHSLDFDHSGEIDVGHSPEFDHSGDIEISDGGDAIEVQTGDEIEAHSHVESHDAVKFISLRNLIYFTAFFGLTGTIFSMMNIAAIITAISSVIMGGFASTVGYKFMKYLKSSESGEAFSIYSLKGKTGTVLINVSKQRKGKIQVTAGDQIHQILAQASDISRKEIFLPGEQVLIIEVKSNFVYVVDTNL